MSKKYKELKDRHPENASKAKQKGLQRHQYLEDLVIKLEECGVDFCDNTDERAKYWKKFKKLYNVDPRCSWALGEYMFGEMYEQIKAYKFFASEVVNLSYHKINYKGKEYTQEEAIDKMLELLEKIITTDTYSAGQQEWKRVLDASKEFYGIWAEVWPCMWW